jgi:hypothetical protein
MCAAVKIWEKLMVSFTTVISMLSQIKDVLNELLNRSINGIEKEKFFFVGIFN